MSADEVMKKTPRKVSAAPSLGGVRVAARLTTKPSQVKWGGAVEEEVEVDCLVDDKLLVEDGGRLISADLGGSRRISAGVDGARWRSRHDGEEGEGDVVHRDDLRVSEQGHARVDVLDLRDARRGEDQEAEVEGGLAELPAPLSQRRQGEGGVRFSARLRGAGACAIPPQPPGGSQPAARRSA